MPGREALGWRRILLLAGFLYFLLVGGTQAGALTFLRVLDTVLGAVVVALWIRAMVRDADVTDKLTLGALLLFLLTCLFSALPRFSFDSATTVLAYAALYGLARRELSSEVTRRLAVTVLTAMAVVFIVAFGFVWSGQWIQWLQASGGTIPPLDLFLSNLGIYTFKYPVAILIAMLLPLVFEQRHRRTVGALVYPIAAIGLGVIVMSGSRSAWTGLVAGLLVLVYRRGLRGLPLPSRRTLLTGSIAAAVVVVVAMVAGGSIAQRAFASSTVELRVGIWSHALSQLGAHPFVGFGPGTFPSLITLSGFFQNLSNVAKGPDSLPVQILAEEGIVGAVAGVILVLGFAKGVRDGVSDNWTRPALAGVAVFLVSALTNDTVHVGQLVAVTAVLAALASPHTPARSPLSPRPRHSAVRWALVLAAVTVAAAVATFQAAAVLNARAAAASRSGQAGTALQESEMASVLDPRNGYLLHQLGLARLAVQDDQGALAAFEGAVRVSPADLSAMRSAALIAADHGQNGLAVAYATRAAHLNQVDPEQNLVLWLVQQRAGSDDSTAIIGALQWAPWLPGAPDWGTLFPTGGRLSTLLRQAAGQVRTPDSRRALQQAWLEASTGVAVGTSDPGLAGIGALFQCNVDRAGQLLDAAESEGFTTTDIVLGGMVASVSNDAQALNNLRTLGLLTNPGIGILLASPPGGSSPFTDGEAFRLYGILELPLAPPLLPILPTGNQALAWWMLQPVQTADRVAPASGLASCLVP